MLMAHTAFLTWALPTYIIKDEKPQKKMKHQQEASYQEQAWSLLLTC